jgi:aryl-alcohol dehydrogenase-like predicted oxidoreductase
LDIEKAKTKHLLATCRELGVPVIAYSPLGRGLLTSTFAATDPIEISDLRGKLLPRFQGENVSKNQKLAQEFAKFAEKKGCTPSQLALAWLLKQGDDIIPTPGTKNIKYLESNWEALQVHLSDDEEKEIRAWAEAADVGGGPIPERLEFGLYVDTVEES